MARANYGFEKRQRELEKKRKKDAKAQKKAADLAAGIKPDDGVPLEPLTGPIIHYVEDDTEKPAE